MGDQNFDGKDKTAQRGLGMAWVPLQAGCLTFAVAGTAILIGLWLDLRLDTMPRWTLMLLIGSAPFALGGVFLIVRRALRKMRAAQEVHEPPSTEGM
jgi:hypothetical protein